MCVCTCLCVYVYDNNKEEKVINLKGKRPVTSWKEDSERGK